MDFISWDINGIKEDITRIKEVNPELSGEIQEYLNKIMDGEYFEYKELYSLLEQARNI